MSAASIKHHIPKHPERETDETLTMTRRGFLRVFGAAAVAATAYGMLPSTPETHETEQRAENAVRHLQEHAPEIAGLSVIDVLGAGLFVHGVHTLTKEQPINKGHYAALGALLAAKYRYATPEQQHHLTGEIQSNFKALGVIIGTITIGDGLKMDLSKTCEKLLKGAATPADKVALLNMFASAVAPVTTTVGAAAIISDTARELAQGDKDFMAVSIGHGSGRAGYLLFGDPPFLAMIAKYGFREAVTWQSTRMLAPALYSLASSTYKMNLILAKRAGLQGEAAWKKAANDTFTGLTNNIPHLAEIIWKSLKNVGSYFGMRKLSTAEETGIQVELGSYIKTRLENLARLPWDEKFNEGSSEDFAGMVTDIDDTAWEESVKTFVAGMSSEADHAEEQNPIKVISDSLVDCFLARDFAKAKELLIKNGGHTEAEADNIISNIKLNLPAIYQEKQDKPSQKGLRQRISEWLAPVRNTTDPHRLGVAFGHNTKDVLNVFPFQANCVPFLLPLLQSFIAKLEHAGLSETQRELTIFAIIMVFSMFADNYVAVKMGLDLLPHKPQIPLIAGIEGGELTSIGNMANMTQFSSNEYSLADSLKRWKWAIDNVAFGVLYSQWLGEASIRPTDEDVQTARRHAHAFFTTTIGNKHVQEAVAMLQAA